MAIDTDDEILQDFIIEAGELIEELGGQLVELEKQPEDKELLNAVFRNFHTVKGGAGFLALDALVGICHRAEDVFNLLRQGDRVVDEQLMDVVLRSYDVVTEMIDQVRNGVEPESADPELLNALEQFATGGNVAPIAEATVEATPEPIVETTVAPEAVSASTEGSSDAAAQLFDEIIDDSSAVSEPSTASAAEVKDHAQPDEISEEEFEALLDQLHGGKESEPQKTTSTEVSSVAADVSPTPTFSPAASSGSDKSDLMTEDEFDKLLDELHGPASAKPDAVKKPVAPAAPTAAVAAVPEPVVEKSQANEQKVASTEAAPKKVAPEKAAPEKAEAPSSDAAPPAESKNPAKEASSAAQTETTVRVDTRRLDDIMNLVGELVLVRNRLATLRASMDEEVTKAVGNLDLVTADLQNSVMKTRMQPIKKVFGRFPRVVRDLARSLNKQVTLELSGEDTDLDKNLVEALADPLVHLVRNAVDHGVEDAKTRVQAGKSENGTIRLAAEQEGDHILLTIEDDGAGMDARVLKDKVVEKGLMDQEAADRLDDYAAYNLIFMPGFSTKTEISDISGRGVGMDVVKTRITQLNGTIDVDSKKGNGSRIAIKVPLTLAIMPTLMVKLSDQIFALPLANVIEIFDREAARTSTVDGKKVVIVREKALPLVFLRQWLVNGEEYVEPPDEGYVVVVSYGSQHVGCVVDQLIGQEEVVIKPLGSSLQGTQGLAGATITGNGRIALILDMPGLMERYGRRI